MKLNLWNHCIELEAENYPDMDYLDKIVKSMNNDKLLSNYFTFAIGQVDYDGKIDLENCEPPKNEELSIKEAKGWLRQGMSSIVRMRFNPFGE